MTTFPFIPLGMDEAWSVGTEMRQLTILRPEVQSSALFRTVLMDDIRRYCICAGVMLTNPSIVNP
jgi:hypothetical protein